MRIRRNPIKCVFSFRPNIVLKRETQILRSKSPQNSKHRFHSEKQNPKPRIFGFHLRKNREKTVDSSCWPPCLRHSQWTAPELIPYTGDCPTPPVKPEVGMVKNGCWKHCFCMGLFDDQTIRHKVVSMLKTVNILKTYSRNHMIYVVFHGQSSTSDSKSCCTLQWTGTLTGNLYVIWIPNFRSSHLHQNNPPLTLQPFFNFNWSPLHAIIARFLYLCPRNPVYKIIHFCLFGQKKSMFHWWWFCRALIL